MSLDEKQVIELWKYWYPRVYGFFFKRVNQIQEVEELTANTLNAFILKDSVANPNAFVWQTARNQLLLFIQNKPKTVSLENIEDYANPFKQIEESSLYQNFKESLLQKCRQTLGEVDYQIVLLSLAEETTSAQIAQKLHLKASNVRQRFRRCLQKIKPLSAQIWQEVNQQNLN
jgi:RNA polymerase sigma factor (sigma-70 family)